MGSATSRSGPSGNPHARPKPLGDTDAAPDGGNADLPLQLFDRRPAGGVGRQRRGVELFSGAAAGGRTVHGCDRREAGIAGDACAWRIFRRGSADSAAADVQSVLDLRL